MAGPELNRSGWGHSTVTVPELGCGTNRRVPSLRLPLALIVSGAVILSSPFIRDIRDWIRATFPGQYATVVATAVALAIGGALVVALMRIRNRRTLRYGAIVAALLLGTAYAMWNAQGNPEVDAVERVHFVEYGLITLLFYRVWRPRGDISMFVLPLVAGIAVGTLEEWLQWFIPGRVGDMRDVFLNVVAIVCGLLFSVGVDPPDAGALQIRPGSLRRIGVVAAAVALLFATFVYSVHLGVEIRDPRHGALPLALRRCDARPPRSGSPRGVEGAATDRTAAQPQSRRSIHERRTAARPRAESALGGRRHGCGVGREPDPREVLRAGPGHTLVHLAHRSPLAAGAACGRRAAPGVSPPCGPFESRADVAEGRHFIRPWSPAVFWVVVLLGVAVIILGCFIFDRGQVAK